jgi:dTDP-4-amino-4,6-dideoxygalactose transaminase
VYDTSLHLQPVFAPWADGPLPGAEHLCARHVCLPVSAVMTDDDVDIVIDSVRSALERV